MKRINLRVDKRLYEVLARNAQYHNTSINRLLVRCMMDALFLQQPAASVKAPQVVPNVVPKETNEALKERSKENKEKEEKERPENVLGIAPNLAPNLVPKETNEERKERSREKEEVKKESRERDVRVRDGFVVPPYTEVLEYAMSSPAMRTIEERDPTITARFYDFYQSKGWMIGSSPMKSWKAALRNWMRRKSEFAPRRTAEDAKTAARDEKEMRDRERARRERLEAAQNPDNWQLCAERCSHYHDGCTKGAKWPPQYNDRPIPPQECRHFASVDKA